MTSSRTVPAKPGSALYFFFSHAAYVAGLYEDHRVDPRDLLHLALSEAIVAARFGVLPHVADVDKRKIAPMVAGVFEGRAITRRNVVAGLRDLSDKSYMGGPK